MKILSDQQSLHLSTMRILSDHHLCNFQLKFSQINISMSLLSLSSPDESSLHYEIEFIIKQKWIDPRLVHDDGNR